MGAHCLSFQTERIVHPYILRGLAQQVNSIALY
jgi:hypothetical protein